MKIRDLLKLFFQQGLAVLMVASFLNAQAPGTGAIAGSVYDPSGALVANARVSVTSEETNSSRTVSTTSDGAFRLPLLPPGNYSMLVEEVGFKQKILRSIHVVVSETAVVNVELEVGSDNVKIEVAGSTELMQTESAALGWVTDQKLILDLPLSSRNFTQILALSPGVVVELSNAALLGNGT